MNNFRVGQKVVCVDASPAEDGHQPEITRGEIYTIRAITRGVDCVGDKGLKLIGVKDPPKRHGAGFYYGGWFRATRFRPAVERKTDISIFTAMLTGPKVLVDH